MRVHALIVRASAALALGLAMTTGLSAAEAGVARVDGHGQRKTIPQGMKPGILLVAFGTTEVVPLQSRPQLDFSAGSEGVPLQRTLGAIASGAREAFAQGAIGPAAPTQGATIQPHDASFDDYRAHLTALSNLVAACAKARDIATCDPTKVGPDDEVPLASGQRRLVRFGWLRVLFSKAQDKDAPPPKPRPEASTPGQQSWENVRPDPPTTTQLLKDAQTRLAADLAQTEATPSPLPDHSQQRAQMKQVLSGSEYRNLAEDTAKESVLEKAGTWLNDMLVSAVRASARAPWLGRALVWGFVAAVCVALVWGLLQLERRWRIRLVPDDQSPAPGAASAIPWQLWLEDARRAAAQGQWREAIHFMYWAAISRLESKRLWPADRARTPREYLALVAPEDPRQPGLATLTGSFERVWYGGRPAGEGDYRHAEQIASSLISGGSAGTSGGAAQ